MERRFSWRLAEKRKVGSSQGVFTQTESRPISDTDQLLVSKSDSQTEGHSALGNIHKQAQDTKTGRSHDQKCETEVDQSNNQKNKTKDLRSKSFLDCLELQPVDSPLDTLITENKDEKLDSNASKKQSVGAYQMTKSSRSKKCKKKVKRCTKYDTKKIHRVEPDEDIENKYSVTSDVENKQDNILAENLTETPLKSSDEDMILNDAVTKNKLSLQGDASRTTEKDENLNNHDQSQVYIFRDVNKVAHGMGQEESMTDLFVAVDLNRHGKKRRYDKLIKKLADGEKSLEINLKEVKNNDAEKADISLCMEKMKEKIQIREKKKYEYLINYMRDQWRVDQKSFQDLLPQKVDLVQSNVVKQLGANIDKVVAGKRKRGRPRKEAADEEKFADHLSGKKKVPEQNGQNGRPKKEASATSKGFPVKFPKSLLSSSTVSQSRHKMDKFRVGIVDKNGGQEFIELNSETLQGVNCSNGMENLLTSASLYARDDQKGNPAYCTSAIIRDRKKSIGHDTSLSRTQQGGSKMENFATALSSDLGENGLTSNILGSKVLEELAPPTTISLPSVSSLERDYELVSLSPANPPQLGNFCEDHFFIPQSTFDQDGKTSIIIVGPFCLVCDPKPRLLLVSPEELKKGPTMILRKKIHSPSNTPPRDFRIHKESRWVRPADKSASESVGGLKGDPVIILLDHSYMTPLKLRDNVKRYCKAVAKHSANAKFIDARVENITQGEDNFVVTIKGDNMLHQVKRLTNPSQAPMTCNKDGIPVVYSLSQVMTPALIEAELAAKREALVLESQQTGDYTPVMFPLSTMGDVVIEVLIPPGGTELLPRTKNRQMQITEEYLESDTPAQHVGPTSSSNSGQVKFLHHSGTLNIDSIAYDEDQQTEEKAENETVEELVVIENADTVDRGPHPGLPCCRVCLRLFPSDYALFTHVRSSHPACDSRDSMYLEELRARSHLACPICCNPPVFLATPPKLRRHLRINHGIEHYVETCSLCQAEFQDKQELDMHLELSHSAFAEGSLMNVHKPHQTGHHLNRQRSVVSDCLSCSRCGIVFMDRASLLSHTLKMHPELNQFNMCRLCDRLFDSTVALHKHLKKAHELTHNGALKCPFCPAWLSSMELASIHRVTLHTGAVPVHCPFCGAGYQNLHLMYNHVRSHHLQTEVHICPQCQDSFPTSRTLSEHLKKAHVMSPHIIKDTSHSACAMTYCCPFCSVSFMRTYDLAIHVINAHREHLLPARCQLCMQSFVSDVVMKMHMSGAHGINIHEDESSADAGFVHQHFDDSQSVTVVLQDDGEDLYTHTKVLDVDTQGRTLVRGHLINPQDILHAQDTDQYISLDDRETIVYLNDRNQVITTGEMFDSCSTMEDVQLLGEANDFNLHGVDYLETLTNDSIAVGADIVADVSVDEMSNGGVDGGQGNGSQDILDMADQFEIDGVLYELAPHDSSDQHMRAITDMISINATDLGVPADSITVDAGDLAHLLSQQVQ